MSTAPLHNRTLTDSIREHWRPADQARIQQALKERMRRRKPTVIVQLPER